MSIDIDNAGRNFILLVRHGEPEFSWPQACNGSEFVEACRLYAMSPLTPQIVPSDLHDMLSNGRNGIVLASTLARSILSARLALPSCPAHSRSLYDELVFPEPSDLQQVLTPTLWSSLLVDRLEDTEQYASVKAAFIEKATRGALLLDRLAQRYNEVVLFGHGIANATLSDVLKVINWKTSASSGHVGYWSWEQLVKS
jgi:broad specificity phosphatase PhoE